MAPLSILLLLVHGVTEAYEERVSQNFNVMWPVRALTQQDRKTTHTGKLPNYR